MKNTLAVVLTYNRIELLTKCLNAIQNQKGAGCDIFVADGDSADGTGKLFEKGGAFGGAFYYNLGGNKGSAGGFGIAVREAMKYGYEYLWIMDDDVIPDKDALYHLLKGGKELKDKWGALASVAYWKDGSLCKANIPKKGLFKFCKEDDYKQDYTEVMMASWASLLVKRDVIKDIGLPMIDYFIYTEDYEYTARISKKYPVYMITKSRVLHEKKDNIKADLLKDSSDRMYRFKYLYRNDVHFYKQFGLRGWMYLVAKFSYTFLRILLREKKSKKKKLQILLKGYREGFRFRPMVQMYIENKEVKNRT